MIGEQDYLYAGLRGFQRRVDRALRVVSEATKIGRVGVSFSGGKDSTALLDLVRCVMPDAPAAFYDSGCELEQTRSIVEHYGVETVKPKQDLLEMCRYAGYWGYETPVNPDAYGKIDFAEALVYEPPRRFAKERDLSVIALGLRANESSARFLNARKRGELYHANYAGVWHLCPLAYWTENDVWAYIASRGLAYNAAYDIMAEMEIPRDKQRIGPLFGTDAANFGRFAIWRRIDPDTWNRLAAEFPLIRKYA